MRTFDVQSIDLDVPFAEAFVYLANRPPCLSGPTRSAPEVTIGCMQALLTCLDRPHRLA